jgi:hypothetical protein
VAPERAFTEDGESRRFWVQLFDDRPDILHLLLRDIYSITKAQAAGAKGGRRKLTGEGSLDDLWDLVTPRFSNKPFAEALSDLMGDQSTRAFASRVGMHHSTLSRLMSGDRPISKRYDPDGSMKILEQIAAGARVHPSYFAEWRRLWLMKRLDDALDVQPNVSVGLFRKMTALGGQS